MATLSRLSGIAVAMLTLLLVAMIAGHADSRLGVRCSAFDLVGRRAILCTACRWPNNVSSLVSMLPVSRHALSRNFSAYGFPLILGPLTKRHDTTCARSISCVVHFRSRSLHESTCRSRRVRFSSWLTHARQRVRLSTIEDGGTVSETHARTFHASHFFLFNFFGSTE